MYERKLLFRKLDLIALHQIEFDDKAVLLMKFVHIFDKFVHKYEFKLFLVLQHHKQANLSCI